jgi:hypothetical protein
MISFDKIDNEGTTFVWNHSGRRGWWRGCVLCGSEAGSKAKKWFRAEAEVDGEREPTDRSSAIGFQP